MSTEPSQLELSQNHLLMEPTPSYLLKGQEKNHQLAVTEQNPHHLELSENHQNMKHTSSSNLEENQLPETENSHDDAIYSELTDINSWVVNQLTRIDDATYPHLADDKFWFLMSLCIRIENDSFSCMLDNPFSI